jgi:1,4-dihydroxy-2-naphthoate octaprenyltransferase
MRATIWLTELRYPFFTATIAPVFLGTAMAWSIAGRFDIIYFILTLAGILCLNAGTNVINDYFDYRSGCDQANKEAIHPFTGGSPFLVQGMLSPHGVFIYALSFFAIAGGIGAYLALVRGWFILVLTVFGIFSGYFYTTSLATRGIGEFFVGLNLGPLLVLGTYYVQTRALAVEPFIAALPLGLYVAAILWINEIPDYNADHLVGKNTAVVRLGRRRAAKVYAYIVSTVYATIVVGVVSCILPAVTLIALLPLHLAFRAMRVAGKNYESNELKPANALTILSHFMVGLLLTSAYILQRLLI